MRKSGPAGGRFLCQLRDPASRWRRTVDAGDVPKNISPRTASMLCYIPIFGWLAAIIVLASPRFRQDATSAFMPFRVSTFSLCGSIIDLVFQPIFPCYAGSESDARNGRTDARHRVGRMDLDDCEDCAGQMFHLPIVGDLSRAFGGRAAIVFRRNSGIFAVIPRNRYSRFGFGNGELPSQ